MTHEHPDKKKFFCTGCGEELENFCFNPESDNIDDIHKHVNECKDVGRTNGTYCSRLFIAEQGLFEIAIDATQQQTAENIEEVRSKVVEELRKRLNNT